MLLHVGHDDWLASFQHLADEGPLARRARLRQRATRHADMHAQPLLLADRHRNQHEAHAEAARDIGGVAIDRLTDPSLVRDDRPGDGLRPAFTAQRRERAAQRFERIVLGSVRRKQLRDAEPLLQIPRGATELLRARDDDYWWSRGPGEATKVGEQGKPVKPRE